MATAHARSDFEGDEAQEFRKKVLPLFNEFKGTGIAYNMSSKGPRARELQKTDSMSLLGVETKGISLSIAGKVRGMIAASFSPTKRVDSEAIALDSEFLKDFPRYFSNIPVLSTATENLIHCNVFLPSKYFQSAQSTGIVVKRKTSG
jgi:hypothetical protein